MAADETQLSLDVQVEAPELLKLLVLSVEAELKLVPWVLWTSRPVGQTHWWQNSELQWLHGTTDDGFCFLELSTLSTDAEFRTVEALYPTKLHGDEVTGKIVTMEDREAAPIAPAFKAKQQHQTKALYIELRPWGDGHTGLMARWWQPEGERWARTLLAEVGKHRPEVQNLLGNLRESKLANGSAPGPLAQNAPPERPTWFPKTAATLKKWRNAYNLICQQIELYQEEYDEGNSDDAEPTQADIRDYLRQEMRWAPSDKTIGRIVQAGETGWLE